MKESALEFDFMIFPLKSNYLEGRDIFLLCSVPYFQWILGVVGINYILFDENE